MKKNSTKVVAFLLIAIIISACNAVKRVPEGKFLLTKNQILVNDKAIKDQTAFDQMYQNPNGTIGRFKLRLALYNAANLNPDSTYQAKFTNNPGKYERKSKWLSAKQVDRLGESFYYKGIHQFLKKVGEPPVIIDTLKTQKTTIRLNNYYFNNGYFRAKTTFSIDTVGFKKAKIKYKIALSDPFILDTISKSISSPALDSLYNISKEDSFILSGKQYKTNDFEEEKNRITTYFRNNGAYHFQPNNVTFDIDTIGKKNKADVELIIKNYSYQKNDSTYTIPFKLFKISDIKIYTDYSQKNPPETVTDSVEYNGFKLFSHGKLKYKPSAITDAVFITKGTLFGDYKTVLSNRSLNNLKIFGYPSIQYEVDKKDSTAQSLIAKIYLTPRKKFSFSTTLDLTHSNIQDFGIGASVTETIRNVFNRAETLEIGFRGNIGSSKDFANPNDAFFNVTEYGINLKLNFPRILSPFNTDKIIPKRMIPYTQISSGFNKQRNIGLDKENFTALYTYNWNPIRNNTARVELLNVQFVRNLNPDNYFNVYGSSYNALNKIAKDYNNNSSYVDNKNNLIINSGTTGFTNDVLYTNTLILPTDKLKEVLSIEERRLRLTENDFILGTSYTFTQSTKKDIQDNDFYQFKTKIESAGTLLSLIAKASNLQKNSSGQYEIFNLPYSEYLKLELDYIKHWDFSKENIIAFRSFFGIALPFGNADYVPFSRSYFSGGTNDNRAWQPYSLGPGSTGSILDFNEANMKIALSAEYRFKIAGSVKGAFFADAGNIWNVSDAVTIESATFTSLNDLKEMALGTGFGLRYDLNFFVVRFDLGFKTYNPAYEIGSRWFKDLNFTKSVLNFGINYPF
ncbi:Outer membrane protein assembly factor BamA [Flavobacterium sp. 9R]|uniref:translocation and assembly module lipoprotein TamL n=1 Tax=Flavobacterium sp. 9R TaxID=2653143 RepID=UPI0012F139C8|nr:BamA/TamA family outer membrane protein [Flavobacterium sp. 9R]VXB08613.1 Outer membrane protein assembly factor BamA [Flavobacterium sp. 9R]